MSEAQGIIEAAARESHTDYTLPDGYRIRVYDFGGIDVMNDAGKWITIASNVESCAALSRIALNASLGGEQTEGT